MNDARTTIAEIAAAEKINEFYIGRVLRLTLRAPDIVEAIPVGRQPVAHMTLVFLRWSFAMHCNGKNLSKTLIASYSSPPHH